jgi:hypothetical protein
MSRQVFLVPAAGSPGPARPHDGIDAQYRDLAQSMAAFHRETAALGVDRRVVTFTDGDLSTGSRSGRAGAQLVMGEAVRTVAELPSHISYDTYAGAMASSLGVHGGAVRRSFPGFVDPAAATRA